MTPDYAFNVTIVSFNGTVRAQQTATPFTSQRRVLRAQRPLDAA